MFRTKESCAGAPWVGPACSKNILSVLVLSSNAEIIERISSALSEEHTKGNFCWKLVLLRSINVEEVKQQSIAIDFVILGMDTSSTVCLEWAQKVISQVHTDLLRGRVVLVNASGLAPNAMAINKEDLLKLMSEAEVDMLNANVYKTEECKNLARRLFRHMEVSVGVSTGLPNLNL